MTTYRDRPSTRKERAEVAPDTEANAALHDNLVPFSDDRDIFKKGVRPKGAAPPWTSETARAAAKKSAESRRQNIADAKAAGISPEALKMIKAAGLERIRNEPVDIGLIGKGARLVALQMITDILAGRLKPRSVAEAMKVGEAALGMSRLLDGEPGKITQNNTTLTEAELREEFAGLVEAARQRKSSG